MGRLGNIETKVVLAATVVVTVNQNRFVVFERVCLHHASRFVVFARAYLHHALFCVTVIHIELVWRCDHQTGHAESQYFHIWQQVHSLSHVAFNPAVDGVSCFGISL